MGLGLGRSWNKRGFLKFKVKDKDEFLAKGIRVDQRREGEDRASLRLLLPLSLPLGLFKVPERARAQGREKIRQKNREIKRGRRGKGRVRGRRRRLKVRFRGFFVDLGIFQGGLQMLIYLSLFCFFTRFWRS
jgi:hypothetical protein